MINLVLRNPSEMELATKMLILPCNGPSHPLHLNTGLNALTFVILDLLLKLFNKLPTPRPRATLVIAILNRRGRDAVLCVQAHLEVINQRKSG